MNTCVSMDCPFIWYCNQYNFEVDRGDHCEHQDEILRRAKLLEKYRRLQKKMKTLQEESHE